MRLTFARLSGQWSGSYSSNSWCNHAFICKTPPIELKFPSFKPKLEIQNKWMLHAPLIEATNKARIRSLDDNSPCALGAISLWTITGFKKCCPLCKGDVEHETDIEICKLEERLAPGTTNTSYSEAFLPVRLDILNLFFWCKEENSDWVTGLCGRSVLCRFSKLWTEVLEEGVELIRIRLNQTGGWTGSHLNWWGQLFAHGKLHRLIT